MGQDTSPSIANANFPRLNPVSVGIRGRCPRCGRGHIFSGLLKLKPRCEVCGLDLSFADPADGPAFFSSLAMSGPVLGFIMWLDAMYSPPVYVHLLVDVPLLLLACVLPLRPLKGWLVASQYYNKAEVGQLAKSEEARGALPEHRS